MTKTAKFRIRRRKDGSCDILKLKGNRLTLHSHHDNFEEAHDELVDLKHKPTQAETLKMFRDLRNSNTKDQ